MNLYTNQLIESVVSMSKLTHEIPHSGFERFLDGLAVVALNGFQINRVAISDTNTNNEQIVN